VKDFMNSRPTLEKVEEMTSEPRASRGKKIDYAALADTKFRTKK
jgi:hypothetical protein